MVCVGSVQVFELVHQSGRYAKAGLYLVLIAGNPRTPIGIEISTLFTRDWTLTSLYVITHVLFFNYFYSRSFLFLGILPTIGELMRVRSMSKF